MVNNCLKSNQIKITALNLNAGNVCSVICMVEITCLYLAPKGKRWHPRSKCQHHKYWLCEHFTEGNAEISWNQLKPVALKQERGQTVTVLFHQQPFFTFWTCVKSGSNSQHTDVPCSSHRADGNKIDASGS